MHEGLSQSDDSSAVTTEHLIIHKSTVAFNVDDTNDIARGLSQVYMGLITREALFLSTIVSKKIGRTLQRIFSPVFLFLSFLKSMTTFPLHRIQATVLRELITWALKSYDE